MARILHMADMHFDSAFTSNLSINKSKLRRSEQREVFSRIIEMVKTEQIDVMLISGDLFDSENVSEETINFMVRKFAEISEIPVLIAAGNHD
ncbi:MAG: metallophosphoesterase family protein, partial [Monoglobus pectinilyticus]